MKIAILPANDPYYGGVESRRKSMAKNPPMDRRKYATKIIQRQKE